MSVSPDSQMMLADLLSYVHIVLRRTYSACDRTILQDAVSVAVESFLRRAPAHVQESQAASRQWLIRAAIFEVNRELRVMARVVDREVGDRALDELLSETEADTLAEESVLRDLLERRLGPSIAETIWLYEMEQCSSQDISAMQRISVTAVKIRITRARKLLRRVFHGEYGTQKG
jgi:DNA-directed RNA polymerase specialized sigma24 family protein